MHTDTMDRMHANFKVFSKIVMLIMDSEELWDIK